MQFLTIEEFEQVADSIEISDFIGKTSDRIDAMALLGTQESEVVLNAITEMIYGITHKMLEYGHSADLTRRYAKYFVAFLYDCGYLNYDNILEVYNTDRTYDTELMGMLRAYAKHIGKENDELSERHEI
jgi:hypothetical protein